MDMPDWTLSGRCFLLGTLPYILHVISNWLSTFKIVSDPLFSPLVTTIIAELLLLLAIKISVKPSKFGVAWRALLLGTALNVGLCLASFTIKYQTIGIYFMAVAMFHWSEFMMQATFNPETTDVDNYMLYHSDAYVIAFFTALGEFVVELYFWPGMKEPNMGTTIGIPMVIFSECLRKTAMWTAKSNFNHYVQFEKKEDHELVSHGIYGLFRHPSYVGFFWWSVGTQLILFNPFCMVAYSIASWKFFSDRITAEEMTLVRFFGKKYTDYQSKVGTGLPFITGYTINTVASSPEQSHDKSD